MVLETETEQANPAEADGPVRRILLIVNRHARRGATAGAQAADALRGAGLRVDVYSLEVDSIWKLLIMLPAMRAGTHGRWEEVKTLAGKEIVVQTRGHRAVNTDGEITTRTPVTFKVLPGAIGIFAP